MCQVKHRWLMNELCYTKKYISYLITPKPRISSVRQNCISSSRSVFMHGNTVMIYKGERSTLDDIHLALRGDDMPILWIGYRPQAV